MIDRACAPAEHGMCVSVHVRILHSKNICCSACAANHSLRCERRQTKRYFRAYVDVMHGEKEERVCVWNERVEETLRKVKLLKNECNSHTLVVVIFIYLSFVAPAVVVVYARAFGCVKCRHCTLYYSYQIFVPVEVIATYLTMLRCCTLDTF